MGFYTLTHQSPNKSQNFKFAAAATAKSPQSCPTLCNPIDGSPPGSPVPGILQARTGLPFSSNEKSRAQNSKK